MESYTQCRMERAVKGGKQVHVAFIPTSFAKVGRHIDILMDPDDADSWASGWIVKERGSTLDRKSIDNQRAAERDFSNKLASKKRR